MQGNAKMREIGGYIELDTYRGRMLHDDGIKLNCGRNALAFLLDNRHIRHLYFPKFMCDSCDKVLSDHHVNVEKYDVGLNFKPILKSIKDDAWLYLVNFYGQLTKQDILLYKDQFNGRLIVDNAQAYFDAPIENIDTLYTCRKFFGVADGAILYTNDPTDKERAESLSIDESFYRMRFLLGRYERNASEFYAEYVENNNFFQDELVKRMSVLTENLLHGVDYGFIKDRRTENFFYLQKKLKEINLLSVHIPEGAYMYPLMIEYGTVARKALQEEKIYIPTLWPAVFNVCNVDELNYQMARDILPLPVDQRYDTDDMEYIVGKVMKCLNNTD